MRRGNGGVVGTSNPTTNLAASGVFSLFEQQIAKKAGNWPDRFMANFLLVAGGGGGNDGAGGAGGVLQGSIALVFGTTYTFGIGAGGSPGASGGNTTGLGLTAIGGGYGGAWLENPGGNGGSGGGGAGQGAAGGSGTAGQGNSGYPGMYGNSGGAGGGALGAGSGGSGGTGLTSSITGSAVLYARGGNSGGGQPAGAANTGIGGGGGYYAGNGGYSAGGSGIAVLSIPTALYTGNITGSPTVTTSGSNTIIQFKSAGTYIA